LCGYLAINKFGDKVFVLGDYTLGRRIIEGHQSSPPKEPLPNTFSI
jgi:hypothetical protein